MKNIKYIFSFVFILSGLAGLVYEVLWTRYLGHFIGNSTFAHAVVLSAFMGGLALGNLVFGRIADKRNDHLRLYGAIELLIGVFAIFAPVIFAVSRDVFLSVASNFIPGSGMALFLKVVFSVPLVLIPATLMGGTLPIMVKFFATTTETLQKSVSILYALNSFGAVLGSLLSAFLFIPKFGLEVSLYLAAAINFLCAGTALLLNHWCQRSFAMTTTKPLTVMENPVASNVNAPNNLAAPLMWAAFFAGVTGMFYEIGWFRFFSLTLGSTTYSFALMLAAFISGITIGSLLLGLFQPKSRERQIQLLILCQIGIALIMASSIWWYERIPYFFGVLKKQFSSIDAIAHSFLAFEVAKYSFCFFIMFVPTLLFGIFLPLATSVVSEANENLGKSVGKIFAFNTVGGVLGGALGGFAILPLLGLQNTFAATALLNGSVGIMLFLTLPRRAITPNGSVEWRRIAISLAVFGGVLWTAFGAEPWAYSVLNSGMFRNNLQHETFRAFKQSGEERTILFAEQDPSGMVTVEKDASKTILTLRFNGKPDASNDLRDMRTQVLLSQLPLILHNNVKTVLNVGIGSGQTAGGTLLYDEVDHLDLAEISPSVVRASRHFSAINHQYWEDPRVNIFVEDARNFLALTKTQYDLIISEPTNVWISGVASLYTKEFFEEANKKLSDDGMLVQWLHLYNMSNESVYLVLRTLHEVFPYISIWELNGEDGNLHDILYVATKNSLNLDLEKMQEKFSRPSVQAEFSKIGLQSIDAILKLQITGPRLTEPIAGEGAINSDIKPILEYSAPLDYFKRSHSNILTNIRKRLSHEKRDLYIDKLNRPGNEALEQGSLVK